MSQLYEKILISSKNVDKRSFNNKRKVMVGLKHQYFHKETDNILYWLVIDNKSNRSGGNDLLTGASSKIQGLRSSTRFCISTDFQWQNGIVRVERFALAAEGIEVCIIDASHLLSSNCAIGIGDGKTVAFIVAPIESVSARYDSRSTVELQTLAGVWFLVEALRTAYLVALTTAALPVIKLSFKAGFVVRTLAAAGGVSAPGLGCIGTATLTDALTLAGVAVVEGDALVLAGVAASCVLLYVEADAGSAGAVGVNVDDQIVAAAVQGKLEGFAVPAPPVPNVVAVEVDDVVIPAPRGHPERSSPLRAVRVYLGSEGYPSSNREDSGGTRLVLGVDPLRVPSHWVVLQIALVRRHRLLGLGSSRHCHFGHFGKVFSLFFYSAGAGIRLIDHSLVSKGSCHQEGNQQTVFDGQH